MYVSRTVFGKVSIVSGSVEMTLSPDFIFSMASKLTALALPKNSPAAPSPPKPSHAMCRTSSDLI